MKALTGVLITLSFLCGYSLHAQADLEEAVQSLAQDAAEKYVNPVVSGFGSNLNTGWFHRTPKASKVGFNVEFGLVGMGTTFSKKDKSFTSTNTLLITESDAGFFAEAIVKRDPTFEDMDESQRNAAIAAITDQLIGRNIVINISGATAIGKPTDEIRLSYGSGSGTVTFNGNTYNLADREDSTGVGGIINAPVILSFAPQITVGTVMGTQLTLRYVPSVKTNMGKVDYKGFGIQHNPQVWFGKVLPVDIAVAYYHQTLKLGKIVEATADAYGLTTSKQIGFRLLNITPYAGFLIESSEMKFKYDFVYLKPDETSETARISFKKKGSNTSRLTIGTNVRFLLVNINADYSFAKNPAYSAGLNFAL